MTSPFHLLMALWLGAVIGLSAQHIIIEPQLAMGHRPVDWIGGPERRPLTDEERSKAAMLEQIPVMDVRLTFQDPDTFHKTWGSDVEGVTLVWEPGCHIVAPAGWLIQYKPMDGAASWGDSDHGNTLAHEILHCLRDRWHPGWDVIAARVEQEYVDSKRSLCMNRHSISRFHACRRPMTGNTWIIHRSYR